MKKCFGAWILVMFSGVEAQAEDIVPSRGYSPDTTQQRNARQRLLRDNPGQSSGQNSGQNSGQRWRDDDGKGPGQNSGQRWRRDDGKGSGQRGHAGQNAGQRNPDEENQWDEFFSDCLKTDVTARQIRDHLSLKVDCYLERERWEEGVDKHFSVPFKDVPASEEQWGVKLKETKRGKTSVTVNGWEPLEGIPLDSTSYSCPTYEKIRDLYHSDETLDCTAITEGAAKGDGYQIKELFFQKGHLMSEIDFCRQRISEKIRNSKGFRPIETEDTGETHEACGAAPDPGPGQSGAGQRSAGQRDSGKGSSGQRHSGQK